jgi:Uma2 family endonuclease
MKNLIKRPSRRASSNGQFGEPIWETAKRVPRQGTWTVEEYLDLDTNHLIEYSDGYLEFLPMPTTLHQWITLFLYRALQDFGWPKLGLPLVAALRVRLTAEKFREPDVVFMLKGHRERVGDMYWDRADLVMEVVSAGRKARHRDLVKKRGEYARAGIPEYWIVDPKFKRITVLWLKGTRYQVHGKFGKGQTATSRLLPGFSVDVSEAFTGPTL